MIGIQSLSECYYESKIGGHCVTKTNEDANIANCLQRTSCSGVSWSLYDQVQALGDIFIQ